MCGLINVYYQYSTANAVGREESVHDLQALPLGRVWVGLHDFQPPAALRRA